MKSVSNLVLYWYLALTVLAVIAPITIPFVDLMWGLILIWIVFLFYSLGCTSKLLPPQKPESFRVALPGRTLPIGLISLGSVAASLFAVKFYTGKTVFEVMISLALKASLYNEYQKHFADQDIAIFTLAKIPAILSMLYLKLAVIYGFVTVIVLKKEFRFKNIFWLLIVVISQLFFSIARGTSFELFEILLLLWFCLFLRKVIYNIKGSFINGQRIFFAAVMFLIAALYSWNISARYSFNEVAACSTADLCLDTQSVLYQVSRPLADFLFKISGYFTFGIFYVSKFVSDFWFRDPGNIFSLLWPFTSFYRPQLKSDLLCSDTIDCGASWVPDAISYLLNLGFLNLLLLVFVLGVLTRRLMQSIRVRPTFVEIAALYFIFLGVVSLPVGNFITASSANVLSFLMIVSFLGYRALLGAYVKMMQAYNKAILS